MVQDKRFSDIISTVVDLVGDFPGLWLKIMGGSPLLPLSPSELQELAVRAGIGDRFEITGPHKWTEVIPLIREFHIYVQASENGGISPVIAQSRIPGASWCFQRQDLEGFPNNQRYSILISVVEQNATCAAIAVFEMMSVRLPEKILARREDIRGKVSLWELSGHLG
jgi:glycosyltransferase involved in cell wall biosynthesis